MTQARFGRVTVNWRFSTFGIKTEGLPTDIRRVRYASVYWGAEVGYAAARVGGIPFEGLGAAVGTHDHFDWDRSSVPFIDMGAGQAYLEMATPFGGGGR